MAEEATNMPREKTHRDATVSVSIYIWHAEYNETHSNTTDEGLAVTVNTSARLYNTGCIIPTQLYLSVMSL